MTSCGIHLPPIKIPTNVNDGLAILARPGLDLRRVHTKRLSGDAVCTATFGFQTKESRYALLGEINVELVGSKGRPVEARWVADRWRERVGAVPDAVEMIFTSTLFSTGEPINIQLRGPEMDGLRAAAADLKRALRITRERQDDIRRAWQAHFGG